MKCQFRHTEGIVLRVSVTERCNFRCRYCIPPGESQSQCGHPLSLETLGDLCAAVHRLHPARKLKITGGEPLVRPGLPGFISRLSKEGFGEVSMTTNASRLASAAQELKSAGLARVNISLDTLNPDRFRDLTSGRLADTLAGIDAALSTGLTPVKLNAVLRESSWRDDVPELIAFAAERKLELRFIELMRTGATAEWATNEFVAATEVRSWLANVCDLQSHPRSPDSPARLDELIWNGQPLRIGWITPHSNPFCDGCNRLRLDSSGKLYRCLMDPNPFSLPDTLATMTEAELHVAIREYLDGKVAPEEMFTAGTMASIGG
jgi:GTP 3',8-cyclase